MICRVSREAFSTMTGSSSAPLSARSLTSTCSTSFCKFYSTATKLVCYKLFSSNSMQVPDNKHTHLMLSSRFNSGRVFISSENCYGPSNSTTAPNLLGPEMRQKREHESLYADQPGAFAAGGSDTLRGPVMPWRPQQRNKRQVHSTFQ